MTRDDISMSKPKSPGRIRRLERRKQKRAGSPVPTPPLPQKIISTNTVATSTIADKVEHLEQTQPKSEPTPKRHPALHLSIVAWRLCKRFWKVLALAGAGIGLLASLAQFYSLTPRIVVSMDHFRDPKSGMSCQVDILNEGLVGVQDVLPTLRFLRIETDSNQVLLDGNFVAANYRAKGLHGGERMTLPLESFFGPSGMLIIAPVRKADVAIIVDYKVLWVHRQKYQWFEFQKDVNGNAMWTPYVKE
jgi:hypothetical protein